MIFVMFDWSIFFGVMKNDFDDFMEEDIELEERYWFGWWKVRKVWGEVFFWLIGVNDKIIKKLIFFYMFK